MSATLAEVSQSDNLGFNLHLLRSNEAQTRCHYLLGGSQRHTLIFGGARSGKTTLFVRTIIVRALKCKSRHAILRLNANACHRTIGLETFPKVMDLFFPQIKIKWISGRGGGHFVCPNGSEIWLGGLEDKEAADKILGSEYSTIYFNECSQISYESILVARTRLAENVGLRQKCFYDLNPVGRGHWSNLEFVEHRDPITHRPLAYPEEFKWDKINPKDNQGNLTEENLRELAGMSGRKRKRFYEGEFQDDLEAALWTMEGIDRLRRDPHDYTLPEMERIVVAVDPSGAANATDDEHDMIGIVVVGRGMDKHIYVLEDCSLLAGPKGWAKRAIAAYERWEADAIVGETNFGGAMVEETIRNVKNSVRFVPVHASRGKVVRAEPVSALATDSPEHPGILHHAGFFFELEDELCAFTDTGYTGERSPNRADAMVWGVSELTGGTKYAGWMEFYRQKLAEKNITPAGSAVPVAAKPKVHYQVISVPAGGDNLKPGEGKLTLRAPKPHMNFLFGANIRYSSDHEGLIHGVHEEHMPPLFSQGCREEGM